MLPASTLKPHATEKYSWLQKVKIERLRNSVTLKVADVIQPKRWIFARCHHHSFQYTFPEFLPHFHFLLNFNFFLLLILKSACTLLPLFLHFLEELD